MIPELACMNRLLVYLNFGNDCSTTFIFFLDCVAFGFEAHNLKLRLFEGLLEYFDVGLDRHEGLLEVVVLGTFQGQTSS